MANAALRTLATAWLAVTLAFIALRMLPGDAIRAQLTEAGLGASAIDERRAALGLDQPIPVQYARYLAALARGDLGASLYTGEAVADVIAARAGSTFQLAVYGAAVMVAVAIVLAAGAARIDVLGVLARTVINVAVGLPSYVTGMLMILIVGLADPDSAAGIGTAAFVIGFHTGGAVALALAESIYHIRQQPYIVAAHGRGLNPVSVEIRHTWLNAILPVLPLIAVQAGFLLGGTVITEIVFARPGLGRLMLDAVLRRDLPVVQALILLSALTYSALLIIAELFARLIDPRQRA